MKDKIYQYLLKPDGKYGIYVHDQIIMTVIDEEIAYIFTEELNICAEHQYNCGFIDGQKSLFKLD